MFQKPDTASKPKRTDGPFYPKEEHKGDVGSHDEPANPPMYEGNDSGGNVPSIPPSVHVPQPYPERDYFRDVLSIPEVQSMMGRVPTYNGAPGGFFGWLSQIHHLVTTMKVPDEVALIWLKYDWVTIRLRMEL